MGVGTTEKFKLYIRYPARIEDEFIIRSLHQNIVGVHLPRQKSRRWCIIDFENKEKLEEARRELKKIRIEGKGIKISSYQPGPVKKGKKVVKKAAKSSVAESSTKSLVKLLRKPS